MLLTTLEPFDDLRRRGDRTVVVAQHGQIALADRQSGEAEKWLRQALTMAERIGNPTLRWKTHLAVGHLHTETKKPEMAQQEYRAARNVIDGMKASTKNPELRANLESSPMFQEVFELTTLD